jgi:hypothetical protein
MQLLLGLGHTGHHPGRSRQESRIAWSVAIFCDEVCRRTGSWLVSNDAPSLPSHRSGYVMIEEENESMVGERSFTLEAARGGRVS